MNIMTWIIINLVLNSVLEILAHSSTTSACYWSRLLNILRVKLATMWHLPFRNVYAILQENGPSPRGISSEDLIPLHVVERWLCCEQVLKANRPSPQDIASSYSTPGALTPGALIPLDVAGRWLCYEQQGILV